MSRGPGRVSRAALHFVQASHRTVDAFEVAKAVYAVEPEEDGYVYVTPAQVVAVRRALAGLVRAGEIHDMGRAFRLGRRRYASHATLASYDASHRAAFGEAWQPKRRISLRVKPTIILTPMQETA